MCIITGRALKIKIFPRDIMEKWNEFNSTFTFDRIFGKLARTHEILDEFKFGPLTCMSYLPMSAGKIVDTIVHLF